jgi:hypothetical protein
MKVAKEILDSQSELALQDLLIDAAAGLAATEPDRAGDGSDPDCTDVAALWNLRPGA